MFAFESDVTDMPLFKLQYKSNIVAVRAPAVHEELMCFQKATVQLGKKDGIEPALEIYQFGLSHILL